jgi:hypothetical protein
VKNLRFVSVLVFGTAMILSVPAGGTLFAADRLAVAEQAAAVAPVTLRLSVVISRFDGDKKVGNLPFVLMIVPSPVPAPTDDPRGIRDGDQTSLQMGSDFPVPSTTVTDGKTVASITYRSLGTNITAAGRMLDEGRFNVSISVQDSQLMSEPMPGSAAGRGDSVPRFQNFRSQNRLILRDGQTVQYTAAADKVSGEVVKVDVTLNVIK